MAEHSEPGPSARRGVALGRRDLALLSVMLAVAGAATSALVRSPGPVRGPGGAATAQTATLDGLSLSPVTAAPPLALDNHLGTPVNIASYRGRAVLVTFLYTHCPDVCLLIASKLHTALTEMPAAERRQVQIIAVSVDPRGDTRTAVAQFLADHEMTGRMQYLVGSEHALAPVWRAWGIASQPSSDPAVVDHTALIYGITARGRRVVLYQSNFAPAEIVHDVRVLARS